MAEKRSYDAINKQITDEAAEWFVEFTTGDADMNARRAFDTWLRKSPEHVRAYLEMFPIWEDAPLLDREKTLTADMLVDMARDAGRNVVSIGDRQTSRETADAAIRMKPGFAHRGWHAFAAGVVLALLGFGGWLYSQRGVYATDVAEQRLISLPDGSDIELNARSRIRLEYRDHERRVELLEGQALFKVAKDSRRPFIVVSNEIRVRAVGTLFDVYRKPGGTTVTVVEGQVAVHASPTRGSSGHLPGTTIGLTTAPERSEVRLAAGEQLRITPTAMAKAERADVAAVTAWRQRRLVFSATPLTEVADEFNRYNSRQLIVLGEGREDFKVNAVFSATDLPSLLRFLRAQPNVTVEEDDREIRVFAK